MFYKFSRVWSLIFKSYRTSSVGSPTIGKLVQNSKRQVCYINFFQYLWCVGSISKILTSLWRCSLTSLWRCSLTSEHNSKFEKSGYFKSRAQLFFKCVCERTGWIHTTGEIGRRATGIGTDCIYVISWYTNIHIVIIYRTIGFALFWGGGEGILWGFPPTVMIEQKITFNSLNNHTFVLLLSFILEIYPVDSACSSGSFSSS